MTCYHCGREAAVLALGHGWCGECAYLWLGDRPALDHWMLSAVRVGAA